MYGQKRQAIEFICVNIIGAIGAGLVMYYWL
jgi:hypothetical protein